MKIANFATQITTGSYGNYTSINSAVPTVTVAIQAPNTFFYLHFGEETWEYTWYNFADISLWSDYGINKSIYDPCPYGYRVPNNGSWTGFPSATWTIYAIDGGAVWSSLWWPATGYRSSASGAITAVGAHANDWSSAHHFAAYSSYYLNFDYAGVVTPSGGAYHGTGLPVRCVQERARKRKVLIGE